MFLVWEKKDNSLILEKNKSYSLKICIENINFKYFVSWQFQSFKKFSNFIILAFKIQNLIFISAIIITFDKDQVKLLDS